jgi:hypothetical protein
MGDFTLVASYGSPKWKKWSGWPPWISCPFIIFLLLTWMQGQRWQIQALQSVALKHKQIGESGWYVHLLLLACRLVSIALCFLVPNIYSRWNLCLLKGKGFDSSTANCASFNSIM